MDDGQLLEAVGRQDQAAMAALFDRYARMVYSIALRVLREPDQAEEVTQQIFLQVWRQPGGFVSQKGSLGAWLALTTRNGAIDTIRRRAKLTPLDELVGPGPRNLPRALEDDGRMERVKQAVHALAQDEQAPLYMAYFDGLTHAEIAERTGSTLETVKTRIRLTLTTVREALGA